MYWRGFNFSRNIIILYNMTQKRKGSCQLTAAFSIVLRSNSTNSMKLLSRNVYLFSVVPLVGDQLLPDHHFSNSVSRISQGIDTVIGLSSLELYRGFTMRTPAGKSDLLTQDFLGNMQILTFSTSGALFKSS